MAIESIELLYLRVASVQDGYLNLDDISEIEVAVDNGERYALHPGDVLMTEGGDFDKLGRGTVWHGEIQTCLHQNSRLRRPASHDQIRVARTHHASKVSISMTSLQDLPVVLPPENERRRILSTYGTRPNALTSSSTKSVTASTA